MIQTQCFIIKSKFYENKIKEAEEEGEEEIEEEMKKKKI
jgi:hypothetical protein